MRTNKGAIKLLLKCIVFVVILTIGINQYDKHIESVKKQAYWEGVENQFNEERFLDRNEIKTISKTPSITAKNTPNFDLNPNKLEILDRLAKLESLGGEKRKILDTNNKYSLGLFHFQATTVQDMYKRFYNKKISITEAVKIAENDELATKLAHDAIFVHGETWHWKISMCKLGMITKNCLTQKQINNLFKKQLAQK